MMPQAKPSDWYEITFLNLGPGASWTKWRSINDAAQQLRRDRELFQKQMRALSCPVRRHKP